jgi:hypothetical protein
VSQTGEPLLGEPGGSAIDSQDLREAPGRFEGRVAQEVDDPRDQIRLGTRPVLLPVPDALDIYDRIDIQVEVPAVRYKELADRSTGEPSATIRERVNHARDVQLAQGGPTANGSIVMQASRGLIAINVPGSSASNNRAVTVTNTTVSIESRRAS